MEQTGDKKEATNRKFDYSKDTSSGNGPLGQSGRASRAKGEIDRIGKQVFEESGIMAKIQYLQKQNKII